LKILFQALIVCALFLGARFATAEDAQPYVGHWSNGRGETLVVTRNTLRFADDMPLKFRDVTRATDGSSFELLITTLGEENAFPGKTLSVVLEKDSMKITTYVSHDDYMQDKDPQSIVTWFKDGEAD